MNWFKKDCNARKHKIILKGKAKFGKHRFGNFFNNLLEVTGEFYRVKEPDIIEMPYSTFANEMEFGNPAERQVLTQLLTWLQTQLTIRFDLIDDPELGGKTFIKLYYESFQERADDYTRKQLAKKSGPKPDKGPNKNREDIKDYCPNSDEYRLANGLFQYILKRNPKAKKPNLQSWAGHVNKMLRIDKRTFEEIEHRIRWSQKDNFWHKNIRSTEKLRNQFDRLTDEMKADKRTNQYGKVDDKHFLGSEAYRDKTYEEWIDLGYSEEDAKWQIAQQERRNAKRN